jgi:hypothetical protein
MTTTEQPAAIDVEKLMGFNAVFEARPWPPRLAGDARPSPQPRYGGACCTRNGCSPHEQPYRQRTSKAWSRCRHRPAAPQRAQRKEGIDDD